MHLKRINRTGKRRITIKDPDAFGNPRKIIVWYDSLSKAKKPPAWMKEILFSDDEAAA